MISLQYILVSHLNTSHSCNYQNWYNYHKNWSVIAVLVSHSHPCYQTQHLFVVYHTASMTFANKIQNKTEDVYTFFWISPSLEIVSTFLLVCYYNFCTTVSNNNLCLINFNEMYRVSSYIPLVNFIWFHRNFN